MFTVITASIAPSIAIPVNGISVYTATANPRKRYGITVLFRRSLASIANPKAGIIPVATANPCCTKLGIAFNTADIALLPSK